MPARAAASSIASGMPSSRSHSSPRPRVVGVVERRTSGRRARARSTNSAHRRVVVERRHREELLARRRAGPRGSSPAPRRRAPRAGIDSAIRRTSRDARARSCRAPAAAAARRTTSSSDSSSDVPAAARHRAPRRSRRRRAAPRSAPARRATAPSGTGRNDSAATWIARRVLPTPPTPVSVTSGARRRRPSTAFTSPLAADEARQLDRQVRRQHVERAQRRERPGQAVGRQLEDPLRLREVAQPVLAEVDQRAVVAQHVADELAPSSPRRGSARRARRP